MEAHATDISQANEGTFDAELDRLRTATDEYRDTYFGRPLNADELAAARDNITTMQYAALRLHELWREQVVSAPTSAEIGSALGVQQAEGEKFWIVQAMREAVRRNRLVPLHHVVDRLQESSSLGYGILGVLGPAVAFSSHHERQAGMVFTEDVGNEHRYAINSRLALEEIDRAIRSDVEAQRAQIETLSLHSQTRLSDEIGRLTGVLILLTLIVVALTLGALILAALH
jgi:hypothetical protein